MERGKREKGEGKSWREAGKGWRIERRRVRRGVRCVEERREEEQLRWPDASTSTDDGSGGWQEIQATGSPDSSLSTYPSLLHHGPSRCGPIAYIIALFPFFNSFVFLFLDSPCSSWSFSSAECEGLGAGVSMSPSVAFTAAACTSFSFLMCLVSIFLYLVTHTEQRWSITGHARRTRNTPSLVPCLGLR